MVVGTTVATTTDNNNNNNNNNNNKDDKGNVCDEGVSTLALVIHTANNNSRGCLYEWQRMASSFGEWSLHLVMINTGTIVSSKNRQTMVIPDHH